MRFMIDNRYTKASLMFVIRGRSRPGQHRSGSVDLITGAVTQGRACPCWPRNAPERHGQSNNGEHHVACGRYMCEGPVCLKLKLNFLEVK